MVHFRTYLTDFILEKSWSNLLRFENYNHSFIQGHLIKYRVLIPHSRAIEGLISKMTDLLTLTIQMQ